MSLANRLLRVPGWERLYVLAVALIMGGVTLGLAVDTVTKSYQLHTPMPWGDRVTAVMEFSQKSFWNFLWTVEEGYEHILAIPRIFYWIDCRWFAMRDTSLVTLNLLLSLGIVLGYVYIARRELFASRWQTTFYGFLVTAMYFNMTNAFNYTLGFMLQHWIVNSVLLAFAYLHSRLAEPLTPRATARRCLLLAALALVAIFSSGSGALCLPVAIAVAVMFGFRWRYTILWAFLAAILIYTAMKIAPASASAKFSVLWTSPAACLKFYLAFLGSPYFRFHTWPANAPFWTWEGWKACSLGLVVLAAGTGLVIHEVWNRREATRYSFTHVYIILLVFGIGLLCCVSRLRYGVYEGTNSKYACTVLLAWLSIVSLSIKVLAQYGVLSRIHTHTAWLGTFATLAVFLIIPAHLRETRAFREWSYHLWEGAGMVFSGVYDPNACCLYNNMPAYYRFTQNYMRPRHLGPFAYYPFQRGDRFADHFTVETDYPLKGEFNSKEVVGTLLGKGALVQGWAWDERRNRAVSTFVFVDGSGRIVGVAHTGRERPDVAALFNSPTRLQSGFLSTVAADDPARPITAYAVVSPGKARLVGVR